MNFFLISILCPLIPKKGVLNNVCMLCHVKNINFDFLLKISIFGPFIKKGHLNNVCMLCHVQNINFEFSLKISILGNLRPSYSKSLRKCQQVCPPIKYVFFYHPSNLPSPYETVLFSLRYNRLKLYTYLVI